MTKLRHAIDSAAAVLAAAGIGSPRHDAEELAAHLAGIDRGRLPLLDQRRAATYDARYRENRAITGHSATVDDEFFARYQAVIAARAQRVPLQHLTGTAAFGPLRLHVGAGVFIPRPETEALLEWAMNQRLPSQPVIVDVCTGSGALAIALARYWPAAWVLGIDDSDTALDYARRNCAGTAVELVRADVATPGLRADLDGGVDLVVANPPYIPDGALLEPEVAQHDPSHALFGGADGTTVIAAVTAVAGRWLRSGGLFAVEHDDTTSALTVELINNTNRFDHVVAHCDLAGRARFVTAVRKGER